MKSLVLKTLLVISVVTVTSVLAWAARTQEDPTEPCKNWNADRICNMGDPALKLNHGLEGSATKASHPGGPCTSGKCPALANANDKYLGAETTRKPTAAKLGPDGKPVDGHK